MSRGSPEPVRQTLGAAGRLGLLTILGGALALRLWGLSYGLPHPLARPDEEALVTRLIGFDGGDPNPHWFMYPTFYLYVLYGWAKALLVAAQAVGALEPGSLADLTRSAPTAVYLTARALSVLLGTLTVAVVFSLGRRVWSSRAGVLAALMLSVAYLHVRESHFFKPDAALGLANAVVLLACVRLQREPSPAAAALAGVAAGFTLGVKYSVAPLVPVAGAALAGGKRGVWRRLVLAGVVAAVTAVLSSPYVLLDYRTFAGWMAYTGFLLKYGGEGVGTGFRYHVEHSFLQAHGLPFSLFALAALVWNGASRELLPVNLFLAVSGLQLGIVSLAYTRYLTPLLPAVCVVSGVALARATERIARPSLRAVVTACIAVVILARPLANAIGFDRVVSRPDTRLLARQWLERHVPQGATILVLGSPWPYTFGDPALDGYRVRRNPTLDPALGIAYVLTHEHPLPFSRLPEAFTALQPGLRLEATISPFADAAPPARTVFETRDAFYVPLAGFDGVVRGGPLIHIYSVVRPPAT